MGGGERGCVKRLEREGEERVGDGKRFERE